ncbi:MAG TPA: hypothetical protein VHA76_00700 [Solirubrobacterales bacterium]|nr:hypothetical protein [Solirubrobacterales bacterium]
MSLDRVPWTAARRFLFVVASIGVLALLAGCGGGSSSSTGSGGDGQKSDFIVGSRDSVTKDEGATEIESGKFPTGHDTDEESTSGREPIRPCSLVTRVEAAQILGGKVNVVERPLGPTCVFTGSGRMVTLVLEEVPIKTLLQGAKSSRPVTAAGHRGYCLRYEAPSVVFAAGKGRVLQVTAACQAGVRFAAVALPRLLH